PAPVATPPPPAPPAPPSFAAPARATPPPVPVAPPAPIAATAPIAAPAPAPVPAPVVPAGGGPVIETRAPGSLEQPAALDAGTLAVTFALDSYGGGQTQLGPEIAWRGHLRGRVVASLAAAARQAMTAHASGGGTIDARLLGGRVALGAGFVPVAGRLSLTADAGVRAGALWFAGHPAAGGPATRAAPVAAFAAYA